MAQINESPLTEKELAQIGKPQVKVSSKVHVVLLRPLFEVQATADSPAHTKYGVVQEVDIDPNNEKFPNTFMFKGRMFQLMLEEYPMFNKMGLPVVYYDIEGRKPISVKIANIENQKSSKFADKLWGKGHSLTNLIASIEDRKKGSAVIYIVMIIVGLLGGIIIDHFAHI